MELGNAEDQPGREIESQEVQRTGPLSYGQRALWFLQQLSPDNCAYNISIAARITGPLDARLLKESFQRLADRHPSLRTVFPSVRGKPVQVVARSRDTHFVQVDLKAPGSDDLKTRLAEESQKPFDLEKGPILRVTLFKLSDVENVLLLVVHHIAVDYSSVRQAINELGMIYSGAIAGGNADLPALPLTYIDYANWQCDMLEGPDGSRLWEYWSRRLSGDLQPINLPFDRPRSEMPTFRGDTYSVGVDRATTSDVRRLAVELNGSVLTCLLAAFLCVLHLIAGQNDLLAGSPLIGRRRHEFDGVIGFFHNPVVIRSIARPGQSFSSFHREISRTLEEAIEHRDFPFSHLVERIKPSRHPGHSPIFQVMFVFYEKDIYRHIDGQHPLAALDRAAPMELAGLDVEFLEIEEPVSMLDLTLTVAEEEDSLTAAFQYNTDLFDRSTIELVSSDFISVLEAVARDPGIAIDALPHSFASRDNNPRYEEEVEGRALSRRERMKRNRFQRRG